MVGEEWRPISGWFGLYEVSDGGRVRSLDREVTQVNNGGAVYTRPYRGKVLGSSRSADGYSRVLLKDGDREERHLVHRLVASAFLGPCPVGSECWHRDEDLSNNSASNLYYEDQRRHGNRRADVKLTVEKAADIRRLASAVTAVDLAREYGVTVANVRALIRGEIWR